MINSVFSSSEIKAFYPKFVRARAKGNLIEIEQFKTSIFIKS